MNFNHFTLSGPCPAVAGPGRWRLAARALVLAAFLTAALGGCYMPIRFDAEVEITRGGLYKLDFDGYLIWVPLYEGLRTGRISPDEEEEKVEQLTRDLTRDTAVKDTGYFKQGRFRVRWRKSGDLLRAKSVIFLRRNEKIIGIKYVKTTGLITLQGAALGRSAVERLAAMGLDTKGELRVKTDARIVEHNATTVTGDEQKILTWKIESLFDPSPKLVLALQ